jgi:2-(3-amino-3-carboxypropyl)histidine synthase
MYKGKKINLEKVIAYFKNRKIEKVCLFYPLQYKNICDEIGKSLQKYFYVVKKQITGCNIELENVDAYVYVGDGLFHPLSIIKEQIDNFIMKNKSFEIELKPVFILNKSLRLIEKSEIENQINCIKARWLNFNKARKIGVLVSVKPGQQNLKQALEIKNRLREIKKEAFLFLCNEINQNEFMNFDIDFWINTACPQLSVENHKNMCNAKEFFIFYKLLKD